LSKADVDYVKNIRKQAASAAEENPFAVKEDAAKQEDDKSTSKRFNEDPLMNNSQLVDGYSGAGFVLEQPETIIFPSTPSYYLAQYQKYNTPVSVKVMNILTGDQAEPFQLTSSIESTALSADGKMFAYIPSDARNRVKIHEVATGKMVKEFDVVDKIIHSPQVVFVDNSTMLVFTKETGQVAIGLDVNTGRKKFEMKSDKVFDWKKLRISPDFRFLALSNRNGIVVYDTKNGKQKWLNRIPAVDSNGSADVMSFDFCNGGTLIGAVCENGFQGKNSFATMSVKDGRILSQLPLTIPKEQRSRILTSYSGKLIHTLGDGETYLLAGIWLIDKKLGGPTWSHPEPRMHENIMASYLVDADHQLVIMKDGLDVRLKIQGFRDASTEQVKATLKSGGVLDNEGLPDLKVVDAAKATRMSDLPGSSVFKSVKVEKPTRYQPFFLDLQMQEPGNHETVLFSDSSAGKLAVIYNKGRDRELTGVCLVDLKTQALENRFDLPHSGKALALSPQAKFVAVASGDRADRVDIYNTEDQKHLVGFRPFKDVPDGLALNAVFVDEETLVTYFVQAGGLYSVAIKELECTAIAWRLPTLEPIYQFDYTRIFRSPNRQLFAMPTKKGILIRSTKTGAPLGYLKDSVPGAFANLQDLAFSEDNAKCAAFEWSIDDRRISLWDLQTGEKTAFAEPVASPDRLQWSGDSMLMMHRLHLFGLKNSTIDYSKDELELGLYDINRRRMLWGYTFQPKIMILYHPNVDCPDGQFWRCDRDNESRSMYLNGYEIPTQPVAQQIANFPTMQNLIEPGRQFLLKVNIRATGNKASDDLLTVSATETLTETLKKLKCNVSDTAVDSMTLQVYRDDYGITRSRSNARDGGLQVILQSGNITNPALWQQEIFLPYSSRQARMDAQEQRQLWNQALTWVQNILSSKPTYDPVDINERGESALNGKMDTITRPLTAGQ
jgi:WD40 repeat protein